jgi:hypothetical protein
MGAKEPEAYPLKGLFADKMINKAERKADF